jgi:DNA-binding transcriptional LysR family regulator
MRAVELRQLRYFSILARELHFGRAANRASVTQSALSQQVAKLEALLGVRLINRDHRGVALTPSGEALRDSVDAIFMQVDQALRAAQDAVGHSKCAISIGLVEYTNLPFIPPALVRLQALYPDVTIARHEMNAPQQMAALTKNSIDVGFGVPLGTEPGDAGISIEPLFESRWVLLMRSDHKLAKVGCVNVCDLARERLILAARSVNAPVYDSIAAQFQRAGLKPQVVYETLQAQVGITLVEHGFGIMIGTTYMFTSVPNALHCRPINGMDPIIVQLCWREKERNSLILDFVDLAVEEAHRSQPRLPGPGAVHR